MTLRIPGSVRPLVPQQVESNPAPRPAIPVEASNGTRGRGHTHPAHPHGHDHFEAGHVADRGCATPHGTGLSPELQSKVEAAIAERLAKGRGVDAGGEPQEIEVFFHVINQGEGIENGDVPREMIDAQIQVLNDAYKNAGFTFVLREVTRTTNSSWYGAGHGSFAERQMKTELHRGDASDLNIYTLNPGNDLLGWATFPWNQESAPKMDGVVLLASSLPGGAAAPYNEGDTGTHEVGHWLGLYHTFQKPSDLVDDTPAHEVNSGRPPLGTDTLPDEPGVDPVHNYMNYTVDDWMHEFTPGQEARMQALWDAFRNPDSDLSADDLDFQAHLRKRAG
ncbi:MAG TPA: zinc metalloprotease [Myxococcaceae bacterium]|nr:zinc metalloprotease [Myxococcaceae bacterium]